MDAKILSLSPEVREAALDARAVQRRILEAGRRAYEWAPAHASAKARMVALSLQQGLVRGQSNEAQMRPEIGGRVLKLATTSR